MVCVFSRTLRLRRSWAGLVTSHVPVLAVALTLGHAIIRVLTSLQVTPRYRANSHPRLIPMQKDSPLSLYCPSLPSRQPGKMSPEGSKRSLRGPSHRTSSTSSYPRLIGMLLS